MPVQGCTLLSLPPDYSLGAHYKICSYFSTKSLVRINIVPRYKILNSKNMKQTGHKAAQTCTVVNISHVHTKKNESVVF